MTLRPLTAFFRVILSDPKASEGPKCNHLFLSAIPLISCHFVLPSEIRHRIVRGSSEKKLYLAYGADKMFLALVWYWSGRGVVG